MIQLFDFCDNRKCEYHNRVHNDNINCNKPALFFISTPKGITNICDSCLHVLYEEIRTVLARSDRKMTCDHTMVDTASGFLKCVKCGQLEQRYSANNTA